MINQKEITIDWITKVSKENKNAEKILVEKVIRALLLLEGLVKQEISFVFKGGTALMLHFNSTKRLSIDIDIIQNSNVLRSLHKGQSKYSVIVVHKQKQQFLLTENISILVFRQQKLSLH